MSKILLVVFLLLIGFESYAQVDPPSGYTQRYGLRTWDEDDNPGADSLNQNWIDIDQYLYTVDSLATALLTQIAGLLPKSDSVRFALRWNNWDKSNLDTANFLYRYDSTKFALRYNNWDKANLDTSRLLYRYDSTKFALRYNNWDKSNLDTAQFLYRYDSTKFALRYNNWDKANLDTSRLLYRYDSTKFALRYNNWDKSNLDTSRLLYRYDSTKFALRYNNWDKANLDTSIFNQRYDSTLSVMDSTLQWIDSTVSVIDNGFLDADDFSKNDIILVDSNASGKFFRAYPIDSIQGTGGTIDTTIKSITFAIRYSEDSLLYHVTKISANISNIDIETSHSDAGEFDIEFSREIVTTKLIFSNLIFTDADYTGRAFYLQAYRTTTSSMQVLLFRLDDDTPYDPTGNNYYYITLYIHP